MTKREFLIKIVDKHCDQYYKTHNYFHKGDSGLDLFIKKDVIIPAGTTQSVDLGIKCQLRSFSWRFWKWFKGEFYNYHSYFLIPRSSIYTTPLIMKNSIGLIDSGYLGNIKVLFYNTSTTDYKLFKGQRYVQLINNNLSAVNFKIVNNLRSTSRGENGLGSTGK